MTDLDPGVRGTDIDPGVSQTVMSAKEGTGVGTFLTRWGDKETMDESVKLTVPAGTHIYTGKAYTTTFTWTLSNVPPTI